MAEQKINKFAGQMKKNSSINLTEDLTEKMYKAEEEKIETTEVKSSEVKSSEENEKKEVIKEEPQPRKAGRPRQRPKEECQSIHLAIPVSLKEEINKAIACHKTSTTNYIISLIKKDLQENGDDYNAMYNLLNKFKM